MQASRVLLLLLLACGACVRSHATACDGKLCAEDTVCVIYTPTNDTFCAPADETECQGKPDGTLCDGDQGTCYGGGCFPVGCGNGIIDDAIYAHPEECDDGNRKSHDGCSSSCTIEVASWTVEAPGPVPALFDHAMAYDVARDSVIVFGGDRSGVQDETWLRKGPDWMLVRPASGSPAARTGHAMAYDGARQRTIMFGGTLLNGRNVAETWAWDGVAWLPLVTEHAPPARGEHAMAFDPIRGVVVLYGGLGAGDVPLSDTWIWDGTDWTQVMGAGPPPMKQHSMVFDPVRGEILVVGDGPTVQTWRFDGAAWSLAATGGPPNASETTLAYDPKTRTVMWMGYTAGLQVQWQWDGTRWEATPVGAAGGTLTGAAAVTDASGPFLFGGYLKNVGPVATQLAWDGTAWRSPSIPIAVSGRQGMGVALDTRRRRLQVFGDSTGIQAATSEAWELVGAEWKLASSAFPLRDQNESVAVYDDAQQATVIVKAGSSTAWDGIKWSATTPTPNILTPRLAFVPGVGDALVGTPAVGIMRPVQVHVRGMADGPWTLQGEGPPERSEAALGYDPIARKLVMFGGTGGALSIVSYELNDTWLWDPTTRVWSEASPLIQPAVRSSASIAWDAARQRLVLVGGSGVGALALGDAWEWDRDLESWQSILVTGDAPGRPVGFVPSLAVPAPDGDGVVMVRTLAFGSISGLAVYRLRWMGPGPLEACRGTLDLDRDGKAGCEDPDCAVACALAAQTCGNAVCDVTESTASCPGDCPARTWCGDFTCASGETPETCPGDCGMPSAP